MNIPVHLRAQLIKKPTLILPGHCSKEKEPASIISEGSLLLGLVPALGSFLRRLLTSQPLWTQNTFHVLEHRDIRKVLKDKGVTL